MSSFSDILAMKCVDGCDLLLPGPRPPSPWTEADWRKLLKLGPDDELPEIARDAIAVEQMLERREAAARRFDELLKGRDHRIDTVVELGTAIMSVWSAAKECDVLNEGGVEYHLVEAEVNRLIAEAHASGVFIASGLRQLNYDLTGVSGSLVVKLDAWITLDDEWAELLTYLLQQGKTVHLIPWVGHYLETKFGRPPVLDPWPGAAENVPALEAQLRALVAEAVRKQLPATHQAVIHRANDLIELAHAWGAFSGPRMKHIREHLAGVSTGGPFLRQLTTTLECLGFAGATSGEVHPLEQLARNLQALLAGSNGAGDGPRRLTPQECISRLAPLLKAGLDARQIRYQLDKIRARCRWIEDDRGIIETEFEFVCQMLRSWLGSKRDADHFLRKLPETMPSDEERRKIAEEIRNAHLAKMRSRK